MTVLIVENAKDTIICMAYLQHIVIIYANAKIRNEKIVSLADNDDNQVNDELLANLLDENNHLESIEYQAKSIAIFYQKIRDEIELCQTTTGDVHDAALELTREWMSYILS